MKYYQSNSIRFKIVGSMLAGLYFLSFMTLTVHAAITWTGEVNPVSPLSWTQNTYSYIGQSSVGTLTIDSGSGLSSRYGYLGYNLGSTGTITVTGAGSKWNLGNGLYVGYSGSGIVDIEAGGQVSNSYCYLGYDSGATGAVTVNGYGSKWTIASTLYIGYYGDGTLTVNDSGVVTTNWLFASVNDLLGNGTINANGGVLDTDLIYDASHGFQKTIPFGTSGTLNFNLDSTSLLGVGYKDSGTLRIAEGIEVNSYSGFLGYQAGSTGTAIVTGSGSKWNVNGCLFIGKEAGNGTLTVTDGGTVTVKQGLFASLNDLQGNGTITTDGAVLDTDLIFDATHGLQKTFTFGTGGVLNFNVDKTGALGAGFKDHATLTIADGKAVQSYSGYLGYRSGSTGTATVTGTGSSWGIAQNISIGEGGIGTLNIESGGNVSCMTGYVGNGPNSSGTVTVNGGRWNINSLYVGNSGNGILNIQAGGQVTNADGYVGYKAGSTGMVTVSGTGSRWTVNSYLYLGYAGNGTLMVNDGGVVSVSFGLFGSLNHLFGNGTIATDGAVLDNDLVFDSTHSLEQTFAFGSGGKLYLHLYSGTLGAGYQDHGTLTIAEGKAVTNLGDGYLGYHTGSTGIATVTGSDSTWTNRTLYIGYYGNGTLNIQAGGKVNEGTNAYIGCYPAAAGTVKVAGIGSIWTIRPSLSVGEAGIGTLNIEAGGQVNSGNGYIGNFSGSNGTVTISGANSLWTNGGSFYIGNSGIGVLTIEAGGQVSNLTCFMGKESGSTGTVRVDGVGSKWTNNGYLYVSNYGDGTLTVTNGATVTVSQGLLASLDHLFGDGTISTNGAVLDADLVFDASHGLQNTLHFGTGGTLNVTENGSGILGAGYHGTGTLRIATGIAVTSGGDNYLGYHSGSNGSAVVTGTGSKWTNSNNFFLGNSGSGTLTIEAGGQVSNSTGYLGYSAGSNGMVTIDGSNSKWTISNNLYVGNSGNGVLNLMASGQISDAVGHLGNNAGSTGTATVTGIGSKWINSAELYVGNSGNGTLKIALGGQVSNTSGFLGNNSGSVGSAEVSGVNSQWTISNYLYVGNAGNGTLTVIDGGKVTVNQGIFASLNDLYGNGTIYSIGAVLDANRIFDTTHGLQQTIEFGSGGTLYLNQGGNCILGAGHKRNGTLKFADGMAVVSGIGYLGNQPGSTGLATITGAGSKWTNSNDLNIGYFGSGTMKILAGGQVSSAQGYLGCKAGSRGTLTVTGIGSKWTSSGAITIGNYGTGTLTIEAAGLVSDKTGNLGTYSASMGTVQVTGAGSKWTNDTLNIGCSGSGMVNIDAGGQVSATTSYLGFGPGAAGTVTIIGMASQWTNSSNLYIGYSGNGILNIGNGSISGGLVTAKTLTLAYANKSQGICTLNGGTLQAGTLTCGNGNVNFNWDDGTIHNFDASTDLNISSGLALKLAATGTHIFNIDPGRKGTVAAILSDATSGGTLTKLGDGLLTLKAANTYTGDTSIEGGRLSISTPYLNDLAGVHISSGALLDLSFAGSDTIRSLYLDGLQADFGTWGGSLSTATHIDDVHFSGTGVLNVVPEPSTLAFLFTATLGGLLWWRRKR